MAKVEIPYLPWQLKLFDNPAKRKIVAKGRRSGFTHGCAHYVIEEMLCGRGPVLWGDTVNGNIDKYVERYFMPILRQLGKGLWHWGKQAKELIINGNTCDFRSADRPENWEGFGYDLMILNEAGIIFNDRYLYENAILPMTLDHDPEMIVGGVPKGRKSKKDGKRHVFYELAIKAQEDSGQRWHFCRATYRDNPKLNQEAIEELLETTPAAVKAQEIEGQFTDSNLGLVFKPEWWKYYTVRPPESEVIRTVQSWDTAFKDGEENDLSVCSTWAQTTKGYFLLDVWAGRVLYPDLQALAVKLHEQYRPQHVLIEDKASGHALIPSLQRNTRIPIEAIKVGQKDKVSRAIACTPLIEQGKVFIPERAPWLQAWISDHEDCPDCEYWDRIDSTSQALNWFIKKQGRTGMAVSRFEL